ncbi:hypothetical protein OROMI_013511 [Orobanche minor]
MDCFGGQGIRKCSLLEILVLHDIETLLKDNVLYWRNLKRL